jgi:hypothetical protein
MRLWRALAAVVAVAAVAIAAIALRGDAPATVARCTGADAVDFDCQARRADALVAASGARAALRDLEGQTRASGYVRAACHQLTHRIGRAAGARGGIGAFGDGEPLCGSGYYHGVTEAVMARLGPGAGVRRATTVCASLRRRGGSAVDYATCIHGMGHGFMEVFDRDIGASLRGCDALAAADRNGCYRGVFMENLASVERPARSALRPDEPLYPCTAVARRYKPECYERQSTYALFVSNQDFDAVFRICATAEHAYRSACRHGLGGDIAAETAQLAPRGAQARARRRLCMRGAGAQARADCVAGAAGVILQNLDGGPAELDAFCASFDAAATQPQHAACLQASEQAYRALLAEQTGDPDQGLKASDLDFVCHLKKSGPGRRTT